ncbi:twin arginine-targeting translocase, TatA/E family protein [Anoxybacillus sp. B7M1]|uniref:Sec-independent protein translocase protein TatA n=1 Tax=Anoxybacteroides rupiense TaxID=311460 RepID=A0ABD5IZH2_9BACL|nr:MULTISPECIES: twin-arginine translocase TatA/TatE family subunit [Anoxybacillus]ANB55495.1 twin arginine-targeting translocase, TatA/E family protein [Anoxybacillus sp. B2M1]ANB65804.1 twin arginine-targeting translocase, TatA/E family protein [Anoxybacillus sp. B7M1]KXG08297.1 Sec-independent protein translocase protein TatAy [Anoxybacillus sp. P3H1B]MBB3909330.1 sec-independent protein translocase protein TatA [Anoxybacillus rupiensis]MBS2773066.1 twin-arginine translocase TatA/TatE famil
MKYLLILLVIVLLFGTKKLPELGKSLGQSLKEFKSATKGLTDEEENNKKA